MVITKKPNPFINISLRNFKIRFFYSKIKENYVWHKDSNNREVFMICLGKFKFQYDNKLPFIIKTFDRLYINKEDYHRIIPYKGILLTLIIEK